MAAELHLAEDALALHLLLKHLEGLFDIVVPDENLHAVFLFDQAVERTNGQGARTTGERICTIRMPMAPPKRGRGHPNGFPAQLELKTERIGMAFRLFWLYAFVRPESEQCCSQSRSYALNQCSEPVMSLGQLHRNDAKIGAAIMLAHEAAARERRTHMPSNRIRPCGELMLPGTLGSTTIDCKANTHGDGRRNRGVVAIEPVSTMAADISNDRALGGNLRLPPSSVFQAQGEASPDKILRCPPESHL